MKKPRIVAFAGSTRSDSFNKKLIKHVAKAAEEAGAEVTLVDLRDYRMPLYDGDLEADSGLPEKAAELKVLLSEADALAISSPEYNGSLSAVLKNSIDWLSRPGAVEGSVFAKKVGLIVSASPGALGGLRGLVHLRSILTNLGVFVIPGQRAVGSAQTVFDANGDWSDQGVRAQIESLAAELVSVAGRLKG